MRPIGIPKHQTSAVVLDFPVRTAMQERLRLRSPSKPQPVPSGPVVYDGGWYHEEAIEEDRVRREREGSTNH